MSVDATRENVALWLTTMEMQSTWYQRAYDLLHAGGTAIILVQPTPMITAEQMVGWGKVAGVQVRRVHGDKFPPGTVVLSLK